MDATSEISRPTVPVKLPAVEAGESFAIETETSIRTEPGDTVPLELELLPSEIEMAASDFEAALPDLPDSEDFEESIRMALSAVGGELLFQMRLENDECRHVAAVTLGSGDHRRVALVIVPMEGAMRI